MRNRERCQEEPVKLGSFAGWRPTGLAAGGPGLTALLGQRDRRTAQHDDPGGGDHAAGELERKQPG